jgi:hypothetical protein
MFSPLLKNVAVGSSPSHRHCKPQCSQQQHSAMGKLGKFETEDVPANKDFHASTRDNSKNKWCNGSVVGCFEVASEPDLDYKEELVPMSGEPEDREAFLRAQQAWDSLKLGDTFVSACDCAPKEYGCCGLVPDLEETKKSLVTYLNKTWVKHANEQLESSNNKVDVFLWVWHNISGKSETRIILIRFHDTTK